MSRKIIIEAVPDASRLRVPYCDDPEAVGDWFADDQGNYHIVVVGCDPLHDDYALLVAVHELIEYKLCMDHGITQETVDDFDAKFFGPGEPGEAPDSPYFEQHRKAKIIEYLLASWLELKKYDVK